MEASAEILDAAMLLCRVLADGIGMFTLAYSNPTYHILHLYNVKSLTSEIFLDVPKEWLWP
jgi:hypothetical protein